jgi:uncharacterized protein (DUF488 family)
MNSKTVSEGGSNPPVIWTIGHSSRPLEVFLALLKGSGIECIADVRRYPGSRANPQFNQGELSRSLMDRGMQYFAFPELGGRRTPISASKHTVWEHAAFRAYADYMDTADFRKGLKRLVQIASEGKTAIMCSEAPWWRCHRAMIADALKADGIKLLHIMDGGVSEHPYTSAAQIVDGELHYGAGSA